MSRAVTLQQLVRRAELYGTELVYGTAERNLHVSVEDLGCLALRLRRIDPEWKLTLPSHRRRDQVGQRNRLVFGLLDAGWPDKRIRAAAGIGATTFRALKAQYLRGETAQISRSRQITLDPPKTSGYDLYDVSSW